MVNAPIESWSSFSGRLERWENKELMFRGVTAAKYKLIPKIGRPDARVKEANQYSIEDEVRIFEEFKTRARAYQDKPPNEVESLVLAQHHGLPTRLLDWTLSPLIAAYFAAEKMGAHARKPDENPEDYLPAIYAAPIPDNPDGQDLSEFEIFPGRGYGNYDRVIFPPHISPRITAQKALLTIHQQPTSAYDPPELEKVVISKKFSAVLKRMLINFGISRATLFPGLDGIAADLAWDYKWGAYEWGK